MTKKIEITAIAIFCLIIFGISFQTFFKVMPDPTLLEKRALTTMPALDSLRDLASDNYTNAMTNFANDNFGFRKVAIRLNNYLDVKLFRTTSNASVIMGSDAMLFGSNDWFSLTHRHSIYTDSQIRDASMKIKAFQDRLKSKGIEFLFVMAPNKGAIYPELVPRHAYVRNPSSERSRWYAALTDAGINYIDVEPDILVTKKTGPVYYKGDHHWNRFASVIASQKMIDFLSLKLATPGPNLMTVGEKPDDHEKTGGGSLDELLGVKADRVNLQPIIEVKGKKLPPGAVFGDSFVHWMYLDKATESLVSVADITSKGEAELEHKLQKAEIKFLVVHIWEANLSGVLSSSKIWGF